jgi:hypothetical protein
MQVPKRSRGARLGSEAYGLHHLCAAARAQWNYLFSVTLNLVTASSPAWFVSSTSRFVRRSERRIGSGIGPRYDRLFMPVRSLTSRRRPKRHRRYSARCACRLRGSVIEESLGIRPSFGALRVRAAPRVVPSARRRRRGRSRPRRGSRPRAGCSLPESATPVPGSRRRSP